MGKRGTLRVVRPPTTERSTPMPQRTAVIGSLPEAFRMVKAVRADGPDWGSGCRQAVCQASCAAAGSRDGGNPVVAAACRWNSAAWAARVRQGHHRAVGPDCGQGAVRTDVGANPRKEHNAHAICRSVEPNSGASRLHPRLHNAGAWHRCDLQGQQLPCAVARQGAVVERPGFGDPVAARHRDGDLIAEGR